MATDTEQQLAAIAKLETAIIENLRTMFEQLKEVQKFSPPAAARIILAIDGHLKSFPLSLDDTGGFKKA